ncbi:type III secretion protein [Vibrio harveyi]|uniref:Type III secretion protein n=1 Tax=Vibrio harveyi TaxID=669 RepID=A0ABN4KTA7_VIBHA|nr:type III secretion protein [Vibrio harveyi]EIO5095972.1 type III secretion protein [Vibrio parahaemolyticus]ELY5143093.1 type III secretion protein [Vibrio vulnificus]AMF96281.1 type III secretion protein [Vibrio harveyi]EKO3870292.1 type III secretion protein [Vibrio harveyi]ELC3158198.1 type III secretion protein [Vibrio harveyi]
MRHWVWTVLVLLLGCSDHGGTQIGKFESSDMANKVIVLLARYKVKAVLNLKKDSYLVSVDDSMEVKAREILTRFNAYFQKEDLNELLESKFASLSKLEVVKGNLLESREIYNKLSVIPGVLRANVVVTGDKKKRVSVLVMSFNEINISKKHSIERFLKGLVNESDKLTVSYFVESVHDISGNDGQN